MGIWVFSELVNWLFDKQLTSKQLTPKQLNSKQLTPKQLTDYLKGY